MNTLGKVGIGALILGATALMFRKPKKKIDQVVNTGAIEGKPKMFPQQKSDLVNPLGLDASNYLIQTSDDIRNDQTPKSPINLSSFVRLQ